MKNTHLSKYLGVIFLYALAPAAHSQDKPHEYAVKGGCVLRAQAYRDKIYAPKEQSRYRLDIVQTPKGAAQWDFTLSDDPEYHYSQGVNGAISPHPYGRRRRTTLSATLHQYDTYEERVTFHNLNLSPLTDDSESKNRATPRFLALKSAVTATTPSGIQITLPAQNVQHFDEMFDGYNGNPDALFVRIETLPNQKNITLPKSPLYKKYLHSVHLALDCAKPNSMIFYQADNTYTVIAVGLPYLRTVMHLDTLTLIVRQRVDLQSVPVMLTVPVDRSGRG